MLYFREDSQEIKTLYSEETIRFIVEAQNDGLCHGIKYEISQEQYLHCLTVENRKEGGLVTLIKDMRANLLDTYEHISNEVKTGVIHLDD